MGKNSMNNLRDCTDIDEKEVDANEKEEEKQESDNNDDKGEKVRRWKMRIQLMKMKLQQKQQQINHQIMERAPLIVLPHQVPKQRNWVSETVKRSKW